MKTAIPTRTLVRDSKKDKRDAAYRLYNDLTTEVKHLVKPLDVEGLEGLVQASMRYMAPPEDLEEITLPREVVKQMALFATQAASRQLLERHKGK